MTLKYTVSKPVAVKQPIFELPPGEVLLLTQPAEVCKQSLRPMIAVAVGVLVAVSAAAATVYWA